MKFFISNTELDAQIKDIKRKLRLSMNGVVSETMTQKGIQYRLNYGVSVPRIREIAREYPASHDLAQRLWHLGIRETMIIATLIQPVDKFDKALAYEWAAAFNQTEIIDQACMNLLSKTKFAPELVSEWINSTDPWLQATGFTLCARIPDKMTDQQIRQITSIGLALAPESNLSLYRPIALAFSRLCRKDKDTATFILKETEAINNEYSKAIQYILNEVKQEMLFLNLL